MPRSRSRQLDYAQYAVTVTASSIDIFHHIPDRKYDHGEPASTYISIEGTLDVPVIRRQSASISVNSESDCRPGAAIGVNDTHWQVVVSLPPRNLLISLHLLLSIA
jgi:hypothetical protein